jgi:hypothetical protein
MSKAWRLLLATTLTILCVGIAVLAVVPRRSAALRPLDMQDPVVRLAKEHISASEGWGDGTYAVENTFVKDGDGFLIVNVIHEDDLKAPRRVPGGGKSLQLRVDPEKKRVVETLHFQ